MHQSLRRTIHQLPDRRFLSNETARCLRHLVCDHSEGLINNLVITESRNGVSQFLGMTKIQIEMTVLVFPIKTSIQNVTSWQCFHCNQQLRQFLCAIPAAPIEAIIMLAVANPLVKFVYQPSL